MAQSAKLRKLDTSKSFTPAELELINKNWWDIEQALASVGAITPGSSESPPADTFLKFTEDGPVFSPIPFAISEIPDHDHNKHLNRLRRVLLPIGAWEPNAKLTVGTDPDMNIFISFTNAVQVYSNYIFQVPMDYVSTGTFVPMATEPTNDGNDFDLILYTKIIQLGITDVTAAYDTADSFPLTPNGANKLCAAEQIISASIAAGDVIRLTLTRLTTDPNATNMRFYGAYFEYVADM